MSPVDPFGKTQLQCAVYDTIVVFRCSHIVMDGADALWVVKAVLQRMNGRQPLFRNGPRSARQLYGHLSPIEKLKALHRERARFSRLFPFAPSTQESAPVKVKTVLSDTDMARVKRYGKARGCTVNDMILAAFVQTFYHQTGLEVGAPFSVVFMKNLRGTCDHPEQWGLCNASGTLPLDFEQGVDVDDFDAILTAVQRQTEAFRYDELSGFYGMPLYHGAFETLPFSWIEPVTDRFYADMGVGVTNLGNVKKK
ncbi:hypothetical protein [uncultured Dubosiella sp.]|uniref:hypothetical protein n=1 Tax=uncultured Dubosiella sp. TaxID=1937011 RepID=UPI00258E9591|nr:hypothetical protein [uncultured Dubosiella sp.]